MKAKELIERRLEGRDAYNTVRALSEGLRFEPNIDDVFGRLKDALPNTVVIIKMPGGGSDMISLRYPTAAVAKKEAKNGIWHNHPKAILVFLEPKPGGKLKSDASVGGRDAGFRNQTLKVETAIKKLAAFFKKHV